MKIKKSGWKPSILLVGSTGQLGGELMHCLRPLCRIVGTVFSHPRVPSIPVRKLDLTKPAEIRRIVRNIHPSLIINASAYNAVDLAESESDRAMAINGIAPGILAEEAKRMGAGIIHFSTDYVFNGKGTRPWKETDRPDPTNMYGRSKLAGENAVQATGVPHLIFRVSWLYGPRGSNFVKTMLDLGLRRDNLKVVSDQVGALTSARFVAQAVTQILAQNLSDWTALFRRKSGTYHLTCGGKASRYECAKEIFRLARLNGINLSFKSLKAVSSAKFNPPAQRPLNSRLNCQKTRQVFGLRITPWDQELEIFFHDIIRFSY